MSGNIPHNVGKTMSETTVKVDEKGRIMIPKSIRKTAKLKEGSYVNIKTKGKTIIMEAAEPVADKYYGTFKITKWPENMDEFIEDVMQKWWTKSAT
jgi:AbrB family looped-hinge helix DNA binding protein